MCFTKFHILQDFQIFDTPSYIVSHVATFATVSLEGSFSLSLGVFFSFSHGSVTFMELRVPINSCNFFNCSVWLFISVCNFVNCVMLNLGRGKCGLKDSWRMKVSWRASSRTRKLWDFCWSQMVSVFSSLSNHVHFRSFVVHSTSVDSDHSLLR